MYKLASARFPLNEHCVCVCARAQQVHLRLVEVAGY